MKAGNDIALSLAGIAARAGVVLMRHYSRDLVIRRKADESPVTAADEEAEALIEAELTAHWSDIPVVGEEAMAAGHIPKTAKRIFLVDPMDGTKEFLNRNGEFTVNIALIDDGRPVAGTVFAPAKRRLFWGAEGQGAFEAACDINDLDAQGIPKIGTARRLAVRTPPPDGHVVLISRTHHSTKTDEYLAHYRVARFAVCGSSLKFCLIATGEADLYPRHGATMEWDTAAGDAVLRAAGGMTASLDGKPLTYGKADDNYTNPYFVASGVGPK